MTAEIIDINDRKEKFDRIKIEISCTISFEDLISKNNTSTHEEMDKQIASMMKLIEDYMSGYNLSIERGHYSGHLINEQ